MERVDIGKYIVKDPEICHGQITFRGTRVPVDTVLTYLAKGYSVDVLLHSWPQLSRPAIEEAVSLRRSPCKHSMARKAEQHRA